MLINAMSIMQAIAAIVSISSGVKLKKKYFTHDASILYLDFFGLRLGWLSNAFVCFELKQL